MVYDRDLKVQHYAAFVCGIVQLGLLVYSLSLFQWAASLLCLTWIACACVWMSNVRSQQKTRDMVAAAFRPFTPSIATFGTTYRQTPMKGD